MGLACSVGPIAASVMSHEVTMTATQSLGSWLSAYLHCCLRLPTSTDATLSLKPQPLALKQSCLTHWAHIPPDTVDGCADYLRKDKLSTSSSIHLTGCLACCQPCASGNVKRYLFSTEDINHKGIFPPAFQKWVEFSCRVLGLQFLQRKAHKEKIIVLSVAVQINTNIRLKINLFFFFC